MLTKLKLHGKGRANVSEEVHLFGLYRQIRGRKDAYQTMGLGVVAVQVDVRVKDPLLEGIRESL